MELKEQQPHIKTRITNFLMRKGWISTPQSSSPFIQQLGIAPSSNQKEIINNFQGIVYQAITTITQQVKEIENFAEVKKSDGSVTQNADHPFFKLLEDPNPEEGLTKDTLIEGTETYLQMVGEFFWYFAIGEQTKKPKAIYGIRPDRVKIILDKQGKITGYKIGETEGKAVILDPYEVYHFKLFNPINPYRGMGPLEAGIKYVSTEQVATDFTLNFIYNNATPSGVLRLGSDISVDAYNEFKRRWREGISGTKNAGKIAIVRGVEVDFTKIGLSLADIDLKAIKDITEDQILKMFRVPKEMMGHTDISGLGRAGIETLEYIFAKRTINPRYSFYDTSFKQLIKRFYKEDVKVGHQNIIPEDKEFLLNYKDKAVDRWLSRDQVRAMDGLEPVGADQLYVPFNVSPVEGASTSKQKKIKIKIKEAVEQIKQKKWDWDITDKSDDTIQETFRKSSQQAEDEYFKRIFKSINKILSEQEKKVLAKVNPKNFSAKDFQTGLDEAEETAIMIAAITPLIISLSQRAGEIAVELLNSDKPYEISRRIESLLKEHVSKSGRDFTRETIDHLAEEITEGFKSGEGSTQIANRIKDVYAKEKGYQAERLARTEAHWAALQATEDAYIENGVRVKKWYANPDACDFCSFFDGKEETVGEEFWPKDKEIVTTNDKGEEVSFMPSYQTIENADLHPNCKCQILPLEEFSGKSKKESLLDALLKEMDDE